MMLRTRVSSRLFVAALAVAVLTAGAAAAPAPAAEVAGEMTIHRRDTFYSDATYTVQVGLGHAGCEGEYWMSWGVQSPYVRYTFLNPCP